MIDAELDSADAAAQISSSTDDLQDQRWAWRLSTTVSTDLARALTDCADCRIASNSDLEQQLLPALAADGRVEHGLSIDQCDRVADVDHVADGHRIASSQLARRHSRRRHTPGIYEDA